MPSSVARQSQQKDFGEFPDASSGLLEFDPIYGTLRTSAFGRNQQIVPAGGAFSMAGRDAEHIALAVISDASDNPHGFIHAQSQEKRDQPTGM